MPYPIVLFLHGTSRRDKEWPEIHWIALGRHLSAQGLTILLPGGNERERNVLNVWQTKSWAHRLWQRWI
ncbi:lipopolysaccharide heptosyltransferase I [mine drainage metagenome]|uniref:Lipopolysaccharide heptosyltransferase I n=1 Tax=mine drainage metagenome TaxID=410659 RepID=T1BYD5_9ZZZZ